MNRSLYRDGSFNLKLILGLLGTAMIVVSLYLTKHYYDVNFPTGIASGSLCDINSFLNCDASSTSIFSNIAGVPISLFGLLIGVIVMFGFLWKEDLVEGTTYYILCLNFIGCLVLLVYSLIALGSLCPFCTVYYLLSAAALFLFYKYSEVRMLSPMPLTIYAVVAALMSAGAIYSVKGDSEKDQKLAASLAQQYDSLRNLGEPDFTVPFTLKGKAEDFKNAKARVIVFSDFECPACKMLSDSLPALKKKYKDTDLNIQYFFYPLDNACNAKMERPLHRNACQAAYLSYCLPNDFKTVHDDIFRNQEKLSISWIKEYAAKRGVSECLNDPKTKEEVRKIVEAAEAFNVKSTPSMLLNGVKIEGVLPTKQFQMLIDHVISKN